MQKKQQFSREERGKLMKSGSESKSVEKLGKQLLKSRISRARRRRQTESEEGNSAIKHYIDRIIEKTNNQMRDRQDSRAVDDGDNEQGSNSSTGRDCPDDSDKQGPANSSNWAIEMDSDEETNSVTQSLSKAIGDATRQLRDKSNSTHCKDGSKKQKSDSSFALREMSSAQRKDRNSMDDGRTVGDQSKENSRANVYTTNTNRRAMKVDESSGRQKGKVGTQEKDEDE